MSKKLKGHKPHCKCVGCSADTRRRGMKALKNTPKRKSRKPRRARRAAKRMARRARKLISKVARKLKFPNPKRRKVRRVKRVVRVARRRRHANPAGSLIGTSAVIHSSRGRIRGARLVTGPGEYRVTVLGTGSRRVDGATVRAIDYRHDAKALRAYGRIAAFRHKFTSAARVLSSGGGRIVIESSRCIWEKKS